MKNKNDKFGMLSMIIGIVAICTIILGYVGIAVSLVGLIFGIISKDKEGKRKIGIILNSIALGISIILAIIATVLGHNNSLGILTHYLNNVGNATGNFYGKPKSIEDIRVININYNNGKDYINITDNEIIYVAYDDNGNKIDEIIRDDKNFIYEIKKYIYQKDLKYLKNYNHSKKEKWSIEVNSSGTTCLISGKNNVPQWFIELLDKLEVEEYGYISRKSSK